jgi:hypothetical protein
MEKCLYKGVLIPHQIYDSNYAYRVGRVAMSNDDETTFSTRVPTDR